MSRESGTGIYITGWSKTCWLFMLLSYSLWGLEGDSHSSRPDTIIVATGEWPPYTSASLPHHGYVNHVVGSAFAESGIKVQFVYLPWPRAYRQTQAGKYHATSYWYDGPKHEQAFLLGPPLTREKVVFFRRQSDAPLHWQTLADFSQKIIGLTRSYTYTDSLWRYAALHPQHISVVNSDAQNIQMLQRGRIDVFPVDEQMGWRLIREVLEDKHQNSFEVMTPPLVENTGRVLFPKARPDSVELLAKFNQGMDSLRRKGLLKAYNDKLRQGFYTQDEHQTNR